MSDIATIERIDAPPAVERTNAVTPMEMLATVAANGGSPEVVEKFMALAERWEANQSRKAFDAALAAAKAEVPTIDKNRLVSFETSNGTSTTSYRHEDLGQIARTVDPILAKHGLSYRYRVSSEINHPVTVTCIIAHRDGHFEETTLTAGRDDSGKKNSIQQIGSTITYLQRYTLKAALGLAASHDDDGKQADDAGTVSDEQAAHLQKLIDDFELLAPFQRFFKVEKAKELPASEYDRAVYELNSIGAEKRGVAK